MNVSDPMRMHPPARHIIFAVSTFLGLAILGVNLFVQLEILIASDSDRDASDLVGSTAFILVVSLPFLVVAWAYWRASIELTAAGVEVRLFSTRVIPWVEMADVIVIAARGGRRVQVRLNTGRLYRLPAPRDQGVFKDRNFDEKFQALYRSWTAHRP